MDAQEEKILIFKEGNEIRARGLELLESIHNCRINIFSVFSTKDLEKLEESFDKLYKDSFLAYDQRASQYSEVLASTKEVFNSSTNSSEPVNLNINNLFSIYLFQVTSQKETLRNLLSDMERKINAKRTEVNNLIAVTISIASIFIACLALFSNKNS
jgi:hypothetical protein